MLRIALPAYRDLSVNDLREALVNYILARQRGEGLVLRLDDSEPLEGPAEPIEPILESFALQWDHLLRQSESHRFYQQLGLTLLKQSKAFVCTCIPASSTASSQPVACDGRCANNGVETLSQLQNDRIPFVLRMHRPEDSVVLHDAMHGTLETSPQEIDSFVIVQADGQPSPLFACAVDNMLSGVTTIVRQAPDLDDTFRQIHICRQLDYHVTTTWVHLPPILGPDDQPLRIDDPYGSVVGLLNAGFLPDAIINYLLAAGNTVPQSIFTLADAISWFDLSSLSLTPVRFDLETLRKRNRAHLGRMDDKALSSLYGFADPDIGQMIKLYLSEADTLQELDDRIKPIFAPKPCRGERGDAMRMLSRAIASAPMFRDYDAFKSYLMAQTHLSESHFTPSLQRLITGSESGPEASTIYPLIRSYLAEVAQCQP